VSGFVQAWALGALLAGSAPPLQEGPIVVLTLEQALSRARETSAALQQAQALGRAADADLRAARAGRLPQVDLQLGYSRLSNVPELFLPLPDGTRRTIFPNIPDNTHARAALSLPLYTGGRLERLVDAARAESAGARQDVRTTAAELELETAAAYWSLVTARESQRVLSDALQAYDAHLSDARNRETFGMAARNEVLAVQVERDRAELAAVRARNAAQVASADLARLVGVEPSAALHLVEPLEVGGRGAEPDVLALARQAQQARPERAAAALRIDAAAARVRAEQGGRLPQVLLSAGLDYANPNRRILPPEARFQESWDVNLSLSWNLFDGGRRSAAVARAEARHQAARSQLQELDRRLGVQVTQRALDLESARAAAEVAERALDAARENQRVAGERYGAGVMASSELLDAEVLLLRAALERTEARAQVRLAEAALRRAVGGSGR
jgi:outer membrane protein TolC